MQATGADSPPHLRAGGKRSFPQRRVVLDQRNLFLSQLVALGADVGELLAEQFCLARLCRQGHARINRLLSSSLPASRVFVAQLGELHVLLCDRGLLAQQPLLGAGEILAPRACPSGRR